MFFFNQFLSIVNPFTFLLCAYVAKILNDYEQTKNQNIMKFTHSKLVVIIQENVIGVRKNQSKSSLAAAVRTLLNKKNVDDDPK